MKIMLRILLHALQQCMFIQVVRWSPDFLLELPPPHSPIHLSLLLLLHKEWKIRPPKNTLHINNTLTNIWVHTHTGQVSLILKSTRLTLETLCSSVTPTLYPLTSVAVTNASLLIESDPSCCLLASSEGVWIGVLGGVHVYDITAKLALLHACYGHMGCHKTEDECERPHRLASIPGFSSSFINTFRYEWLLFNIMWFCGVFFCFLISSPFALNSCFFFS